MPSEKTIKLSRRYEAHGRTFDSLTFREPKMADFEAIGEIWESQPTKEGGVVILEHTDRIWRYRDRLIKRGESLPDAGDLGELVLKDAVAVKDTITGFFSGMRAASSAAPPTS